MLKKKTILTSWNVWIAISGVCVIARSTGKIDERSEIGLLAMVAYNSKRKRFHVPNMWDINFI